MAVPYRNGEFMTQKETEKETEPKAKQTRGLLIASASLLLLFGVAFLKGRIK
jgi:hypothetical protein